MLIKQSLPFAYFFIRLCTRINLTPTPISIGLCIYLEDVHLRRSAVLQLSLGDSEEKFTWGKQNEKCLKPEYTLPLFSYLLF